MQSEMGEENGVGDGKGNEGKGGGNVNQWREGRGKRRGKCSKGVGRLSMLFNA